MPGYKKCKKQVNTNPEMKTNEAFIGIVVSQNNLHFGISGFSLIVHFMFPAVCAYIIMEFCGSHYMQMSCEMHFEEYQKIQLLQIQQKILV